MKTLMPALAGLLSLMLVSCGGEKKQAPPPDQALTQGAPADTGTPPAREPEPRKPAPAPAGETTTAPAAVSEKDVTITGEVIDLVSYAASGTRGDTPQGKEIITNNARGGNPLGILQRGTGAVYLAALKQTTAPVSETLIPFVGMQIAAKGDLYRKGGQRLLVIHTIGKSIR
ncbi:MAG: hypothetical protein WB626_03380 [Bacteroidota bacterium]